MFPHPEKQAFDKPSRIIFMLLFLVAAAAASSLPPSWTRDDPPTLSTAHSLISPRSSSSSSSLDLAPLQDPKVNLLERAPPNGGPLQFISPERAHGWNVKYRQYFSFIIPVQVAASVLEEFLKDCLRRIALKQARDKPSPGNAFTMSVGRVFLAFRFGDLTGKIEWWAVEIIVQALLENVRMGFTTQFKSEWFHAETGKLLYVSLSMLQRIGPGSVDLKA